jgi:Zn-dependent M16 (insulinase) family peptidase
MEGSAYGGFEPALDRMLEVLPSEDPSEAEWSRGGGLPKHEGLVVPARVNYVGKGLDLAGAGYEFNGAHLACVKHARMAFLWDRVRVQGGAYGAFCSLDRFSGSLIFASYRDPNLGSTLRAFDDAVEYFKGVSLDRAALEKSVIGAMGDVDAYMLPDAKGFASMARELTGDTPEVRRKMREELLSAGQENFRNFGEAMARALDTADVVVLGSEESLKASPVELTRTRVL